MLPITDIYRCSTSKTGYNLGHKPKRGMLQVSPLFPFNIYPTNSKKHSHTTCSLVNKFPAFYGNNLFITAFTTARHCSLPLARYSGQCTPHSRLTFLRLFQYRTYICTYIFRLFHFRQVSPSKSTHYFFSP